MATAQLEIFRKGRFEGKVTGDDQMDEGRAIELLDSWLDAHRYDRGLRPDFTIRLGRREVRWA